MRKKWPSKIVILDEPRPPCRVLAREVQSEAGHLP